MTSAATTAKPPSRSARDPVLFAGSDPKRGIVIRGYADLPPEPRRKTDETGELSTDLKDGPSTEQYGSYSIAGAAQLPPPAAVGSMWSSSRNIFAISAIPLYTRRCAPSSFARPRRSPSCSVVELLPTPDILLEAHRPDEPR